MALNNTVRATIRKPTLEELQLPATTMLPPGPGNNWGDAAFRQNHSKKQALSGEFKGTCPSTYKPTHVRKPEEAPVFASRSAMELTAACKATEAGMAETINDEKPESLDGKALKFFAYLVQQIPESAERDRVRYVNIVFYLADDTVMIQEPRIHNSGLQGGVILKRQRVELSRNDQSRNFALTGTFNGQPSGPGYLAFRDINVGNPLVLLGTTYNLYDCDVFTRTFMAECGIEVGMASDPPEDPYVAIQRGKNVRSAKSFESKDLAVTMESMHSSKTGKAVVNRYPEDIVRVQRFLNDSGKMLRFYAYWNDDETQLIRTFEIRYFVEDDTIAIVESVSTGDAISKSFLSRRRVPKKGTLSKGVDLTFSGRVNGMRDVYLGDKDSYYDAADILVGGVFNLFGRQFNVYNSDECTRDYYKVKLGIELEAGTDISHLFPKRKTPKLPVPPPTGFGSPEDSRSSCKGLVLAPPKKRPINEEANGATLRFQLKFLDPDTSEDKMRSFVLTFYLDDGEIMITEVALRNTGFTGGKFMRKQRLVKTGDGEADGDYFKLDDIYMGATLKVSGFNFYVSGIDVNSAKYLENKSTNGRRLSEMSSVSHERVHQLLQAFQGFTTCRFVTHTEAFRFFDKDLDGKITLGEFLETLKDSQITRREEEAVAMMQALDQSSLGHINYKDFFKAVTDPMLASAGRQEGGGGTAVDVSKARAMMGQGGSQKKRVLKALKERLEARCLNVFEMFRMLSTMPRAFRGRRADMTTLTNSAKDTLVTPVQVRRGVDEHLGMRLATSDMACLLKFFYPDLPEEDFTGTADNTMQHSLDLKTFQAKFTEMEEMGQLH